MLVFITNDLLAARCLPLYPLLIDLLAFSLQPTRFFADGDIAEGKMPELFSSISSASLTGLIAEYIITPGETAQRMVNLSRIARQKVDGDKYAY